MYIGYYKSVDSSKEFYTNRRENLDFPMQVSYEGHYCLLVKTIVCDTPSKLKNITMAAEKYGIPTNVDLGDSG